MTTFTRIPDDARPSISVDPDRVLSEIKPEIYPGFTEHMGRCVYGGLYDPGNPLSDENGFRKDVIKVFQDLRCPVVRYPGGNFGVGPKDQRPSRPELAWDGIEQNQFGTDEFMKWCDVVGTQPYLALNMGTGTLDEALGLLEYCNGDKNTYWANLRRKNGHEKPYNVKYWALGNEVYGERQTGYSDWDRYVLQECIKWTDMHSIHIYTADTSHPPNATAPRSAERVIEITASLIDLARICAGTEARASICFDEWNIWDPIRAPGNTGAEELYTVSDMLAMAAWCNVFIRQSAYLGMANIAQNVNVIAPVMTTPTRLVKQTTYYPFFLFANYMRGRTLGVHMRSGVYEGRSNPAWVRTTMDMPWLDVSAAVEDGHINLAVANISEERDWEVEIKGVSKGAEVKVFEVKGEKVDDVNSEEKRTVGIEEKVWTVAGETYLFKRLSFTLLRWKL
ncbi:glycoside hydrolase [Choiromyces venosus 120613-1]|uniref:non-reducing end alpha-L-arabinofuranosidase n=1 Tax=Choiromyces venosus 120613-1 TaxID=1336337 RepID=A0A3N4K4Z9_9PEZI|nr:glycoside hydrolase [Choiromyces venosus 120613-1]